jgi:putative SOS response-associated peptidase YedK
MGVRHIVTRPVPPRFSRLLDPVPPKCSSAIQAALAEREFFVNRATWKIHSSYNIAPTQEVPVVRAVDGEREGLLMRWGLIPFFAHGEPPKYSTINARIETVETAASYRGPWKRSQRCLKIASGFYEWHTDATGRKAPYLIQLNGSGPLCVRGALGSFYKA